jgi:hypothetical protein
MMSSSVRRLSPSGWQSRAGVDGELPGNWLDPIRTQIQFICTVALVLVAGSAGFGIAWALHQRSTAHRPRAAGDRDWRIVPSRLLGWYLGPPMGQPPCF